MLPSAEPVTKKSSKASSARALMAESWAWKVWSSCRWRMSNTHTKPFLPPVISSCCLGAYCSTVAPFSWQGNAERVCGKQCEIESNKQRQGKSFKFDSLRHFWISYRGSWYCLVKSEYPTGKRFCGQINQE